MKADVAQQNSLLELAGFDSELSRLAHRSAHLPEQQRYDEVLAASRAAADRVGMLTIAVEDLDAQVGKREAEVDAVRRREDRDRGLLDSGSVTNSKQLEELQHELGTLQRRQASLEDELLEVMERREQLAADLSAALTSATALDEDLAAAAQSRNDALAEVEQARDELAGRRALLVARIDGDLLNLYERQRATTGIGAGRLQGRRCGACRLELDRGELARVSAAPADEVLRCPECQAILLRSPGAAE